MEFVWDERKRQTNIRKHGVDFADAVAVFFDNLALFIEDPDHHDEQRFITIGIDTAGHTLVVVYTYIDEDGEHKNVGGIKPPFSAPHYRLT